MVMAHSLYIIPPPQTIVSPLKYLNSIHCNTLKDQSRWVRMAAFQALGPFISTFADPLITALLQNQNGEIVITDPDQLAETLAKVLEFENCLFVIYAGNRPRPQAFLVRMSKLICPLNKEKFCVLT